MWIFPTILYLIVAAIIVLFGIFVDFTEFCCLNNFHSSRCLRENTLRMMIATLIYSFLLCHPGISTFLVEKLRILEWIDWAVSISKSQRILLSFMLFFSFLKQIWVCVCSICHRDQNLSLCTVLSELLFLHWIFVLVRS